MRDVFCDGPERRPRRRKYGDQNAQGVLQGRDLLTSVARHRASSKRQVTPRVQWPQTRKHLCRYALL